MKKSIYLFISLIMCLSLVGCSKTNKDDISKEESSNATETKEEPKKDISKKRPTNVDEWKELIPNPNAYFKTGKLYYEFSDKDTYNVYIRDVKAEDFEKFYRASKKEFTNLESYIMKPDKTAATAYLYSKDYNYYLQLAMYETVEYKEEGEVKLKHEDGTPVLTAAIFININEQYS